MDGLLKRAHGISGNGVIDSEFSKIIGFVSSDSKMVESVLEHKLDFKQKIEDIIKRKAILKEELLGPNATESEVNKLYEEKKQLWKARGLHIRNFKNYREAVKGYKKNNTLLPSHEASLEEYRRTVE